MPPPAPDLTTPVDYSMDKWRLGRVPWALWVCVAGLAVVLHADSRGANGAVLAFVYLALLGLVFAGWAATTLIDRSMPFFAALAIGLVIIVVVALIIALLTGTVGRTTGYRGTLLWSRMVDPPLNVFGWMLLYLGGGYSAYALFRHHRPGRPILRLTPAGLSFHRPWLADVVIPWQDIQGVGPLEISNDGAPASTYPNAIAVTVTHDFYERAIAPKRSFLAPLGSERMFQTKDTMMQMVVTSGEVAVKPADYLGPIAARWEAFRGRQASVPQSGGPQVPRITYGRWSFDGSWRQTIKFVAPLIGMAAVVLHATGLWPT